MTTRATKPASAKPLRRIAKRTEDDTRAELTTMLWSDEFSTKLTKAFGRAVDRATGKETGTARRAPGRVR